MFTACRALQLMFDNIELTVDSRGHHHIKDLGAVAGVDELIRTERVVAQRAAARLILCFHDYHHIETVAGKIFSLDDRKRREKAQRDPIRPC